MNTNWVGRPTVRLKEVDSTNETVKRYASQGAENGTLIVAERQTAGKGRRGRSWESGNGENLLMSVLLRPSFAADKASMLTIVTAMAVCRGLERIRDEIRKQKNGCREQEACLPAVRIKWPNDVLLGTRKVCGILTELMLDGEGGYYVVIGVGVNVNTRYFPGELEEKAASLCREWGRSVDREAVMERIWQEFEAVYGQFLADGDLSVLREEYENCLVNRGQRVHVCRPGAEFDGIAGGIDTQGRLSVSSEDGEEILVDAGEVSVRGIYGYV